MIYPKKQVDVLLMAKTAVRDGKKRKHSHLDLQEFYDPSVVKNLESEGASDTPKNDKSKAKHSKSKREKKSKLGDKDNRKKKRKVCSDDGSQHVVKSLSAPNNDLDKNETVVGLVKPGGSCEDSLGITTPESSSETAPHVTTPTSYTYSDVLQLEHAVTKLLESYECIVKLSPTFTVYQRTLQNKDKLDVQLLAPMQRYKLKLAAELKSLSFLEKPVLFKDITDYSSNFEVGDPSPVLGGLTKRDLKHLAKKENIPEPDGTDVSDTNSDTVVRELTYEGEWPPPLPEIKDPVLKARVFVHKSTVTNKVYINEEEAVNTHNERLEFLGDTFLNTIMTYIIYKQLPTFNEGQLSTLRTRLVSNNTLKEWSILYKLDQILRTDFKPMTNGTGPVGKQKIKADVFEAYIGALIEEDPEKNIHVVKDWLRKLAQPIIKEFLEEIGPSYKIEDVNAKRRLYSLIGYAALNLHYEVVRRQQKDGDMAVVACKIGDGTVLGTGEGRTVKLAGIRAAEDVLGKKDLIEKYANIRASIPRCQSAVRPENSHGRKLNVRRDQTPK